MLANRLLTLLCLHKGGDTRVSSRVTRWLSRLSSALLNEVPH